MLAVVLINVEVGNGLARCNMLHGVENQKSRDDNPERIDEQDIEIEILVAVSWAVLKSILPVGQIVEDISVKLAKGEQHLQPIAVVTALHEGKKGEEG